MNAVYKHQEISSMTSEEIYELGKVGQWTDVLSHFKQNPLCVGKAVRYVQKSSGWSLLHQAAYWGNHPAVAVCLKFGANLELLAKDSKTPIQVAADHGHAALSERMQRAVTGSLWKPVADDPSLRAASNKWCEHNEKMSKEDFKVGYAGGEVDIKIGDTYYIDSWGRVLIGWHGSYSPPCGMDGDPQI